MKLLLSLALLLTLVAPTCYSQSAPGKVIYQSSTLTVTQVSPNAFVHTSFLASETYGKVACNGLIVRNGPETIVFDTPATTADSQELLDWISRELHCRVKAVVPTHFHDDCVGGLPEFARRGIPSYANAQTIRYARQRQANVPEHGFQHRRTLKVGRRKVLAAFLGEGHTRDNIVGYFPDEKVLFGGCLVKELNATKGNLADANVQAWSATVEKVKQAYPQAQIVIPGHGQVGDQRLLDYTIRLFQQP